MKLQMHESWCILTDDEGKPITDKTWWEANNLAAEMSARTGKNLVLIPVKTAEKMCKTDKAFKKMLVKYWIWNAELMKVCKNNTELRKKLGLETKECYQWVGENGLYSVRSTWNSAEGCFHAYADRPSYRDVNGVVAFLNTSKCSGRGLPKSAVLARKGAVK